MQKSIAILLLFLSFTAFGQYENQWKEVYKYELDGKIQSAQKEVQEIYKKAKKKKDEVQIVKCFFYLSKFEQVVDENAQSTILSNLKKEIREAKPASKALLNYVYAQILQQYYARNSYQINRRTPLSNRKSSDFLTWTTTDFTEEIKESMSKILADEKVLRSTTVNDFKDIFEIQPSTDAKNYNLYDFLVEKSIAHYKNKVGSWQRKKENNDLFESLYADSKTFIGYKTNSIEDENLKKLIRILQENEKYYLQTDKEKADFAYFERLKYANSVYYDGNIYQKSVFELEKNTKNIFLKQALRVERIKSYNGQTSKHSGINKHKEALALIDTVLQAKTNINAMAAAESVRNEILRKSLDIQLQKVIYPNQNNRAFINFRNVDSVKISYYYFPVKQNHLLESGYYYRDEKGKTVNTDSIVLDFKAKNAPEKTFTRKLPGKEDYFSYSTEILLEKMDVGNYLVFMETLNNPEDKSIAYTYEQVLSTNLFPAEDYDEKQNIFYISDRKTGKPIENVIIKNEEETIVTDKNGKAAFGLKKFVRNKKYDHTILIIKDNDTLRKRYNRHFIYDSEDIYQEDDYENFEAKAMVYFDRAIYRPGQKMYYKGVLVQNKDNVKSVAPEVSVHIKINDVNGTTLKEFDVQTNEFGSFSGEFDIPKNTLTGLFYMTVDEADDVEIDKKYYDPEEEEHKFWDNVNFDSYDNYFYFQVEEYKRPTFEVKFDEIKENYTIGDTLKIKGNAKALAGNNLTNAKVAYTVSKSVSANQYFPYEQDFITTETTTDENGNFTIEFPAVQNGIPNDSIRLLTYNLKVDITDSQGETRSSTRSLKVGKNMLDISLSLNRTLYLEDNNTLTVNATTLNGYPIEAKGEIKIYEIRQKSFLKQRLFSNPEIQTISRNEFEQLFPYEPYERSYIKGEEVLVKTLSFDTKVSKKIILDFLKNFPAGNYKITAEVRDIKDNLITKNEHFSLSSKKSSLSKNELFTWRDISKPNAHIFEFEIGSVIPDLWITGRFYGETKSLENEQTIQLKNGKAILKFHRKPEYKDNIYFHFSTIWENQSGEKTHKIEKELLETKLSFEIVSLRNKIEPGSLENWSFRILDTRLEAEVLAGMYDSSLDQFAERNWENVHFSNHSRSPNYPMFDYSNTAYRSFTNFRQEQNYYASFSKNPDLYWFGFNFTNPKDSYILKKYLEKIRHIDEIPANSKRITGVVLESGMPLPGATVIVKSTNRGTQTDFDGAFSIEAVKGEIIEVSFIGMKTQSITIDKQKRLEITLTEDSQNLSEVVVVGYGTTTKETSVSSVSVQVGADLAMEAHLVDGNDFNYYRGNVYNKTLMSLQGKVSGLTIQYDTLANGRIIARDISFTKEKNNPIYVIDGVIVENTETLNANDIDSFNILKDVAATSLYGNRGANGVIVITTKIALKELAQVKTRTNFNETAFFYPHLKTDKEGKVSFSFTTPESLTKWKLRLFGHNKKAETGYFESNIISQKDVMIQTNMPRFVREKDTITISAKVVNMTLETKSGMAMLMLYDAVNMKAIDSISLNTNNIKEFHCKPKESVPVSWKITIPEGLQGLQYKIVAKSGNFSDGEENILPVLSQSILLTESIPVWVKGKSKKEYTFDNLLHNDSKTLKNHLFTLEYTSNPTWLVLQSLPYLMQYEHECAEQTFARYYANFIAAELIESNPKISALFEKWKNEPKSVSKLNMNEELKSIVLSETPWLLDAENQELKNKRLALLMDLNTMKESQENTLKKLQEKQLPSGAFPWFDGGEANVYITQHIILGLGRLSKKFPEKASLFENIITKAVPYLDDNYIRTSTLKNQRINYYAYSNLHYLYMRSLFADKIPVSKKTDSIISVQKIEFKANWLQYSLYQKGLLALTMHRLGDKDFARKIMTHLKETVARNDDYGMYWVENKNGYYWYQSAIETQAMLIEAFSEIEKDKTYVDEMKVWLLKQKQLHHWSSTKSTTEAVYALLLQGTDWTGIKDNTKFKIGDEKILTRKLSAHEKEAETGYIKMSWNADEIEKDMGKISVDNKSNVAGYGGLYWQYFENLENIKSDSSAVLSVTKNLYKKAKTTAGDKLLDLSEESLKPGDLITIRLIIKTENDLEFVHLKDLRASCFEPVDVISSLQRKDGLNFYRSTKDVATHFFFDTIKKGTYILEYDVRINHSGVFNDGIATIQSMYAPEFSAHSTSSSVKVE